MNGESARLNTSLVQSLPPALVIGNGPSGLLSAKALSDMGIAVTVVKTESDQRDLYCSAPDFDPEYYRESLHSVLNVVELVDLQKDFSVRRLGDDFEVRFSSDDVRLFGCVFLTSGVDMKPVGRNLPQSVSTVSSRGLPDLGKRVAFLLNYDIPSTPGTGMASIRQAMDNVAAGGKSFVVMRDAPVAHLFGETLYDEAKRAGVEFYRFGDELPEVSPRSTDSADDAGILVTVIDTVAGDSPVTLDVDRLVIAPTPDGASVRPLLKEIAINDVDEDGFLLSSSIHCHSGRSFASGIFAVGEVTGNLDLIRVSAQAGAAAVRARAWMLWVRSRKESESVTFTDACVRCLTCLRVCPHNAISFVGGAARSKVSASPAACRECGVCVSECPRLVLDLVFFPDEAISSFVEEATRGGDSQPIVVFGCQRSPGRAASRITFPPEVLFLPVPCAGRISESVLWATIAAGVKGILVVGCHHGNCASNTGTDWAKARVAAVLDKLGTPDGMQPSVKYATVAANEEARFSRIVREFCLAISENCK